MNCDECNGKLYIPGKIEDEWIPCDCLLKNRLSRLALNDGSTGEILEYPDEDHLIVSGNIPKALPIINNLIWLKLIKDIDINVAYAYSGDLTCALMEDSINTIEEYENPDVLFIYLVLSESTPKLVGRMVNRIYEVRKNEGLRTHFISPYGGVKLNGRYTGEDAVLANVIQGLKEIIVK